MTKYINKSDLVAEIKRLLAFYLKEIEENKEDPWAMDIAKRDILQEVLSFIDTLEVKEVDLDADFGVYWGKYCDCDGNINDYEVAKHFFELGLKTQKGK